MRATSVTSMHPVLQAVQTYKCVSEGEFELSTAKQQCAIDSVSKRSLYWHMHVLHWPCPGMTFDVKLLHVAPRKCVDTSMVDAKFHHPQKNLHGLHCCQVLDFRHRGFRSICPHIKRHAVQLTRFSLVPYNSYHRYNVHVQHPKWSTSCLHISSRHSAFYQNPLASHAVITLHFTNGSQITLHNCCSGLLCINQQ